MRTKLLVRRSLFGTVLILIPMFGELCGCAAKSSGTASGGSEQGITVDPRTHTMFRGDGTRAEWSDLVAAARGADVVVLGENHGHEIGLNTAAALWEEVLAERPRASLSMEFFERDEQSRLDEYLTGLTDEKAFKERTRRTEGNYPAGHRRMVEAAKAAKRPVIASNAPRPYVRAARLEGFERLARLTDSQRGLVRVPDALPEGRYREDFFKVMESASAAHGGKTEPTAEEKAKQRQEVENTFRSQSVWDWTMAESVVRAAGGGDTPVVHVVGRFHSDFRGGLVQAMERLRPGTRVVVVSFVDDYSPSLRVEDAARGDYVIYVGAVKAE